MCEVVSLCNYRKSLKQKKDSLELESLYRQVDEIMNLIGEPEPEPYFPSQDSDIDVLIMSGIQIGPSETALFNAYYTLVFEGREDLAELVMEILKMK